MDGKVEEEKEAGIGMRCCGWVGGEAYPHEEAAAGHKEEVGEDRAQHRGLHHSDFALGEGLHAYHHFWEEEGGWVGGWVGG